MRTTLTLDPDVEHLLRLAMHREKASLKETLNAAFRRGLAQEDAAPFVVQAKPMGLRAGLNPARLHDLADDLELQAFAATTRKLSRARR